MSAAGDGGPSLRGAPGFTLIEMLVILAILSLVSGIAFPALDKAMRRQAFADSCARVELALRAARAGAVRGDAPVVLAATLGGHGLAYAGAAETLPETSVLSLAARGIAFFADGSASGGTVALADGGRTCVWRIDPATGAIARVA